MKRSRTDGEGPTLTTPLSPETATVFRNALLPTQTGYARKDVLIADGKIAAVEDVGTPLRTSSPVVDVDCSERLLLPGFVNAHTHSTEHWARGLIKPLPLELWVQQLLRHEPRGEAGWNGPESYDSTPSEAVGLSAMHCGVEALLSGCTAILDHLFVRHLDDLKAAVQAYKALGVRAFIAVMLNDDASMYENYTPRSGKSATSAGTRICSRRAPRRSWRDRCCPRGRQSSTFTRPDSSRCAVRAARTPSGSTRRCR